MHGTGDFTMILKLIGETTQQQRWRRWLQFGAGLTLLAFVALNAMAYIHARAMTHFTNGGKRTQKPEALTYPQKLQVLFTGVALPRPVNRQTPNAFDLSFETVSLTNSRGIRLETWLIRRPDSKGTVLLFHGYGESKDSLLLAAKQFYMLDYNTLLVDFYGSGGSHGNETSIGFKEADDVLAAFRFARRQSPYQPVILYGVSMGAAAILAAVHIHQISPDALILECPFDRMLSTIQNRFRAMHMPSFPSAQLLAFWGGVQQGYNGFGFNPADYMSEVHCPVLLMHGEKDSRVTLSQMNRLTQNLNSRSHYKVFAGLQHQSYVAAQPNEWHNYIGEFLMAGSALPSRAASPQPETVVRKLYQQIVTRHPLGIPRGADQEAIWPLLSTRLIQGLETARACEADYDRQHPPFADKQAPVAPPAIDTPQFGWLESGLFSGRNEEALPAEAVVGHAEPQKDGAFQVDVKLTYKETFKTYGRPPDPQNKFSWHAAARVILERGQFVVDDVLLFKAGSNEIRSHLLDAFKECQKSHWIGDGSKKQQEILEENLDTHCLEENPGTRKNPCVQSPRSGLRHDECSAPMGFLRSASMHAAAGLRRLPP
jgi:uncharacterized protein